MWKCRILIIRTENKITFPTSKYSGWALHPTLLIERKLMVCNILCKNKHSEPLKTKIYVKSKLKNWRSSPQNNIVYDAGCCCTPRFSRVLIALSILLAFRLPISKRSASTLIEMHACRIHQRIFQKLLFIPNSLFSSQIFFRIGFRLGDIQQTQMDRVWTPFFAMTCHENKTRLTYRKLPGD